MAMYDPSLRSAVLRLLERWGRLPLSDLVGMLDPLQRPRFRTELLKDMEWEGLLRLQQVGDEVVVERVPRGTAGVAGTPALGAPPSEG
jgi:hypothetical protein